ncbi:MAG: hypothetical protein JWQ43_3011 [Glaciihabitans sp.]|nr:hypothetical protein [Glaciihabitans sp.]
MLLAATMAGCTAPQVDAQSLVATSPAECAPTNTATPEPDPTEGMTEEERQAFYDEMMAASAWQEDAGHVIAAVKAAAPDEFAEGRMLPQETGFQVSFDGAAPPEALAALTAATVPYKVVENVGFTETETGQLSDTLGTLLQDIIEPGLQWSAGLDPQERELEVEILLGEDNEEGQAPCRSVDPVAVADDLAARFAADGVDTFGFDIVVTTNWGEMWP